MIDIHCHILYGVDDGADSLATAIAMGRDAWESGVRAVIATPHCAKPGEKPNFYSPDMLERLGRLQRALIREEIGLKLYPGMEIFVTKDFREQLRGGNFITLAGSKYLLVEFFFDESPAFIAESLELIRSCGLTPVLAHPERYYCVEWDPELAASWADQGCVLQLNRGSIQGKLGAAAMGAAWALLEKEKAHIVASDAHGVEARRAELRSAMLELGDKLSWAYATRLLVENPRRILENRQPDNSFGLPQT